MAKRYVSIWFRYLTTDWFTLRKPALHNTPFVLTLPDHGRMVVTAANALAVAQGVHIGMVAADAKAIIPYLQVFDDKPGLSSKLLKALAEWCIRYTPVAAVDLPDGIILDATGCAHLWGGEAHYVNDIITKLKRLGYHVHAALADTIGTAWAVARFGEQASVVENAQQMTALLFLPPMALRLREETVERLQKLGLRQINDFIRMPRSSLRRRFGVEFLKQLDKALGNQDETIQPVQPLEPYQERLPSIEPVVTAAGIEFALQTLLDTLCNRLKQEEKGLRNACFKCYRVDGKIEKIEIGTNRPTYNTIHLFKLFEHKLPGIEPALGIELFILEAPKVEDVLPVQNKLWEGNCGIESTALSELIDRVANKMGAHTICRYLPDEHYWPERSVKRAVSVLDKSSIQWRTDRRRPIRLLSSPELIEVAAPIPDYPPMLFRYKGRLHNIKKADGPERIEREWWLDEGEHRDYYCVEDENGQRYWVFRSGHYSEKKTWKWFIHGFFA